VAVLGAMVSTLGRSEIDRLLPGLSSSVRTRLASGLGSGGQLHGVSTQILDASQRAFVYALQYGLRLSAGVALLGALLAWVLVAKKMPMGRDRHETDLNAAERGARAEGSAAETVHV
jgi:hypothetical protein